MHHGQIQDFEFGIPMRIIKIISNDWNRIEYSQPTINNYYDNNNNIMDIFEAVVL